MAGNEMRAAAQMTLHVVWAHRYYFHLISYFVTNTNHQHQHHHDFDQHPQLTTTTGTSGAAPLNDVNVRL